MPTAVAASATIGAAFPGLASAVLVGGVESVLRNSVFRVGYESLYVPISKRVKRSAKSIIDVGFDRMGSVVGGGAVYLLIFIGAGWTHSLILATAVALSLASVLVVVRLRYGYVHALEKRLQRSYRQPASQRESRGSEIGDPAVSDGVNPLEFVAAQRGFVVTEVRSGLSNSPALARALPQEDLLRGRFAQLRSGKPEEIGAALSASELDRVLAPQAISHLARREVSQAALEALQKIAPSIIGLLTDELLDQDNHPQIRILIPQILRFAPSERTVDALMRGFDDEIFDVRFQCGRALAEIRQDRPEIKIAPEVVYQALKKELSRDGFPGTAEDLFEAPLHSFLTQGIPLDQVHWKLEHTFMVLSLVVDREPLRLAFQGLHSAELAVRGTAIEYLTSLLPRRFRSGLLPTIEQIARKPFRPA